MRTLERLLQVMTTVNPSLYPLESALFCNVAARFKDRREVPDYEYDLVRAYAREHRSAYISDLADDVWYWIGQVGSSK